MAERARRDEAGVVEVVILLPIVFLVILLTVQAALWYLARTVATDAAQDGARAAAVVGGSPAAGQQAATAALHQLAGPLLRDTAVETATTAERVTVSVTGRAQAILPGLSLSVRGSAAQPRERFAP